jgi:hypothetical protein
VTAQLSSFVYSVTDMLGLGEFDVIYTVTEGGGDGGGGEDLDGILFGAWSAAGESVGLLFGTWSGVAVEYEPVEKTWSA